MAVLGQRHTELFWKIAAWTVTTPNGRFELEATGYVLDQTSELDNIDLSTARALAAGNPPPLGPYKTYQVPITDIAGLTGLTLGPLTAADRLQPVPAARETNDTRARWILLQNTDDIQL